MGQASDFLFAPLSMSQNNEATMSGKERQQTRGESTASNAQIGQPEPSLPDARDIKYAASESCFSGSPRTVADSPKAEHTARDVLPESSAFWALGRLLHSILVLGALDARNRYGGASSQIGEDNHHPEPVNASCDGTEMTPGPVKAVDSDHISTISLSSQRSFEATVHQDGIATEEMPVYLRASADANIGISVSSQPRSVLPNDFQGPDIETATGAQPLFQSFARPSVTPAGTEETQSLHYDDLAALTDDHNAGNGHANSGTSQRSSDLESEDETTSITSGDRRSNVARTVITGKYHRKSSPLEGCSRAPLTTNKASVPPIHTVTAARKPTLAWSPVRQASFQVTISDETEPEDATTDGTSDVERDALPPFNKLERKDSE
ncbi:MAG: hypothetical protein L6R39_000830 [Caloplaca ligustica]|nr:MAG: hypothetical protein L6R39_000830 [Caloplaca ligustica]